MHLIVGLGNPDPKYLKNRHNIGFMVIDKLIEDHKASDISKNSFRGKLYKFKDTLFLKPYTYMNLSGESVYSVCDYYKPDSVVVVHDDLDLPFGTVRMKVGGGNGGHNGLKSIDSHIGKEYIRLRIGIGKPQNKDATANFVLSDFPKAQSQHLSDIIAHGALCAVALIKEEVAQVASRFSLKDDFEKENL
ncbi:MAG: aminoacyl-tRNA hydrolase [Sulfurospirillum sp.]|nr:aminoacyl-tRNA hydrolase [Sulfurospirillum sp.]